MRELDERLVSEYGIAVQQLMEQAGYQLASFVRDRWSQQPITVYAGPGNNGGDGMVAARSLSNWGYEVTVVCPATVSGMLEQQASILDAMDIPRTDMHEPADLVIDAVFGNGLEDDPRSPYDAWIHAINRGETVVAADVPSGRHAGTGEQMTPCVDADHTVTFGLPTTGLKDVTGECWLADIGMPRQMYEACGIAPPFDDRSLVRLDQ